LKKLVLYLSCTQNILHQFRPQVKSLPLGEVRSFWLRTRTAPQLTSPGRLTILYWCCQSCATRRTRWEAVGIVTTNH